jgi:hypothetical protein
MPLALARCYPWCCPRNVVRADGETSRPKPLELGVGLRSQIQAPVSRESAHGVTHHLARGTVEMPLGLELVEGLLIPVVGNHIGAILHEFPEAMEFGRADGVRVAEALAE